MSLVRKALLAGSTSPWLRNHATRYPFVKRSVSRFMPGEQPEDALRAAGTLAADGIGTMLTHLGENLTTAAEAEAVTAHYLALLENIAASRIDAQISVKPTQLGLDLDRGLCESNLRRIIERVERLGSFVWTDMESSPYVDPTLALYRTARASTARIGLAMQAYLLRTARDVETLIPSGPAIRIVKGAYLEPADIAFTRKEDTDASFFRLCARLLSEEARQAGVRLQIATHDMTLVDQISAWIAAHDVSPSQYELAMLYGIRPQQQLRLAREGRRLRVLISYGEYWFPWFMRRLAERPANVLFVLKNLRG
jgi:proline dehydrogenase